MITALNICGKIFTTIRYKPFRKVCFYWTKCICKWDLNRNSLIVIFILFFSSFQDTLVQQLETCTEGLHRAERFETMGEVYKLLIPFYERSRNFQVRSDFILLIIGNCKCPCCYIPVIDCHHCIRLWSEHSFSYSNMVKTSTLSNPDCLFHSPEASFIVLSHLHVGLSLPLVSRNVCLKDSFPSCFTIIIKVWKVIDK